MQIGWAGKFFEPGKYFEGDKILVALAVLLGFNVLYLGAAWWSKIRGLTNKWLRVPPLDWLPLHLSLPHGS